MKTAAVTSCKVGIEIVFIIEGSKIWLTSTILIRRVSLKINYCFLNLFRIRFSPTHQYQ